MVRRDILDYKGDGIYINTISGGIVNFGGAIKIAPVSITINTGSTSSSGTNGTNRENPNIVKPPSVTRI